MDVNMKAPRDEGVPLPSESQEDYASIRNENNQGFEDNDPQDHCLSQHSHAVQPSVAPSREQRERSLGEDQKVDFNLDVLKRFKRVDAKRVRNLIVELMQGELTVDQTKRCGFAEIARHISSQIKGVTENTIFVAMLQEANKNYYELSTDSDGNILIGYHHDSIKM